MLSAANSVYACGSCQCWLVVAGGGGERVGGVLNFSPRQTLISRPQLNDVGPGCSLPLRTPLGLDALDL